MTLSKDIIDGNYQRVEQRLLNGEEPNILDEYGYTPLIHACGTNRVDMVKLLLKHHAETNSMDISGQTALHWAVNNNNTEISRLLLMNDANPNAYSENGQPVLFYPLLRHHRELIKLLTDKGANLDFAHDYIQAKLLGHRFEIKGNTDIINGAGYFLSIDLEGFYLEFTLQVICESLERFMQSYVANRMDVHKDELKRIIFSFKNAFNLRSFKHFSVDIDKAKPQIAPLLELDLLLLPVSYRSHAITFIKHGDFFAKCDRGVEKMTVPINIFKIGKPEALTTNFLADLIYKRQTERSIKYELVQNLKLNTYAQLPIKHQVTGNCSWANVESSVPTMLYMLLHDKTKNETEIAALVNEIMQFYRAWLEWDKDRAIEDWLLDFDKMSFARQKSKAALLGAIMFQGCSANKPEDVARSKKMMKILARKEFHYIMRTYINLFLGRSRSSQGQAFARLIEACGYQVSDFKY